MDDIHLCNDLWSAQVWFTLELSRMRFRAKLHDRLRCLAVAWVAWLEARGHVQDDEEDDELLVTYNDQGLIRFTRPRTE